MNVDSIQTGGGRRPREAKSRRRLLAFFATVLAVFTVGLAVLLTVHLSGTANSSPQAGRSAAMIPPTAVIQSPAGSRTHAILADHSGNVYNVPTDSPGSPIATAMPTAAVLGIFIIGANGLALAAFAVAAVGLYLIWTGAGLPAGSRNHRSTTWPKEVHPGSPARKNGSGKRLSIFVYDGLTSRTLRSWAYRAIRDFHGTTNSGYCIRLGRT